MTKLLTPKNLLILLMCLFSTAAIAQRIAVKNADGVTIYYDLINNKTELVVRPLDGFRYYSGNVVIPESVKYNGKTYRVTSIGDETFDNCSGLTSVTIPNSVTSICSLAFSDCIGLTSITIPNSVTFIDDLAFLNCSGLTSITIPNSVTFIGVLAFSDCIGLTSIMSKIQNPFVIADNVFKCSNKDVYATVTLTVPKGTKAAYQATEGWNKFVNIIEADGDETQSKEVFSVDGISYNIVDDNSVAVTNSGVYYTENIVIPSQVRYNGNTYNVTSIEAGAFSGCSSLPSITIPNSISSIGNSAFYACMGLHHIVSEIENPFAIDESVFHVEMNGIYDDATLTVPFGTKAKYQATDGWKRFGRIVEAAGAEIEFSIDGITYHGSSSDQTALVKSVDTSLPTVEIPASVSYEGAHYQVSGIDEHAFDGSTMAALVWNVDASLPSNAFSNASMGSNFLLYVKSGSYAPSSVKNVVVNGTAQSIVLSDDGGQFCCPQSFMAEKISYTHNYSMETGGDGKGWETIALPFNVQKISHGTRGEIVPFASYNGGSSQKPFWLASMSSSGFSRSSSIQANQPYIIAMPNSNKYQNDYNLAGDVTFSAENVSVPATPTFSGTFLPAYSTVAKSASVYALNVKNRYVSYSGNYDAGSRFISSLRDVRPFEAYISESSTRGIIEIGSGDGTAGMPDVIGVYDADRLIDIYTLSGQKVAQSRQGDLDNVLNQLPHGVYIVNGKKIVK